MNRYATGSFLISRASSTIQSMSKGFSVVRGKGRLASTNKQAWGITTLNPDSKPPINDQRATSLSNISEMLISRRIKESRTTRNSTKPFGKNVAWVPRAVAAEVVILQQAVSHMPMAQAPSTYAQVIQTSSNLAVSTLHRFEGSLTF